jgi:uncharacterized membrane protein
MNDERLVKILTPWERRHPLFCSRTRIVAGVSLLIVAAILISYDVWWGVLLVPVAALAFYASYRLPRAIRATANSNYAK